MAATAVSDYADPGTSGLDIVWIGAAVSGTNPAIVCLFSLVDATATITGVSVSAGLTAGTPVEVISIRNGTAYISIWVIPAPAGTGTITATRSATVEFNANAILFQGAHQTTPCPGADAQSTTGSTSPLNVTCPNVTANDAIAGMGSVVGGDNPQWTVGTQTFFENSDSLNSAAGYREGNGGATVTFGATGTEALAAVRVAAAAAGLINLPRVTAGAEIQRPFNMQRGRR